MLKQIAKRGLQKSGAYRVVQRFNRNSVRILMYHRFPQEEQASFDRQCALLARKYTVVSLEEAVERFTRNEPIENVAVITIDDGYADVYDVALPVLRRHKLPATLFVTTGFINRTCWMPGDRVRHYFAETSAQTVTVQDDDGRVHAFATKGERATDGLRALLKRVPEATKQRMLREMDGDLPVPSTASTPMQYRPCTWDQLREIAENGIRIGAHTVTHPILSRMDAAEAEQEIVASKLELERQLQRPVQTFAYPNGMPEDISQSNVDSVREHFAGAVTAVAGINRPGSNPYALSRLPCEPGIDVAQMARLLAGPLRRTSASRV